MKPFLKLLVYIGFSKTTRLIALDCLRLTSNCFNFVCSAEVIEIIIPKIIDGIDKTNKIERTKTVSENETTFMNLSGHGWTRVKNLSGPNGTIRGWNVSVDGMYSQMELIFNPWLNKICSIFPPTIGPRRHEEVRLNFKLLNFGDCRDNIGKGELGNVAANKLISILVFVKFVIYIFKPFRIRITKTKKLFDNNSRE